MKAGIQATMLSFQIDIHFYRMGSLHVDCEVMSPFMEDFPGSQLKVRVCFHASSPWRRLKEEATFLLTTDLLAAAQCSECHVPSGNSVHEGGCGKRQCEPQPAAAPVEPTENEFNLSRCVFSDL